MALLETAPVLHESDLAAETGLPAREIHGRLVVLSRAQHRVESALAFYLLEVERRALFVELGHASTVDYARECLGLEDRKTRTLLGLACRLERLPKMKEAFRRGELPYTKAREAVRVATPENEEAWVEKCKTMSNRQIEQEVSRELPPERSRMLFFALDESRIAVWDRVREGMERLAGKTLTDIEVGDLICAEALCTYDTTPPLGDESQPMGGYIREIIERDGFKCTRPGCSNRSCLTASHIESRAQGGSDEPSNMHTACIVCHHAIETGRLKVRGKAPDEITWESPFGVIEKPRLKPREPSAEAQYGYADAGDTSEVKEPRESYAPWPPSFLTHVGRTWSHVSRSQRKAAAECENSGRASSSRHQHSSHRGSIPKLLSERDRNLPGLDGRRRVARGRFRTLIDAEVQYPPDDNPSKVRSRKPICRLRFGRSGCP